MAGEAIADSMPDEAGTRKHIYGNSCDGLSRAGVRRRTPEGLRMFRGVGRFVTSDMATTTPAR